MRKTRGTRLISIRLPASTAARVARVAKARHTTVSAVIREVVDEIGRPPAPSLWDKVKPLIGKKGSGVGDLSTNKKHLEDFGS